MSQLSGFHKTLSAQLKAAMVPPYGAGSLLTIAAAARTLEIFAAELVAEVEALREHVEKLQQALIPDAALDRRLCALREHVEGLQRQVGTRDVVGLPDRVESLERAIFGRDRG